MPNKWLPSSLLILALDPSNKRQSQSSPVPLPHPSHTLWWWRAGDSNAPPPDYESGVLPIHYTSGTAHERVRLARRARRTRADAATRARATDLEGHQDSRMYDDMRRIRTEALLPYVKKWMGRVWDWLLDWVDRLRMLWKLFSGAILIHTGLGIRRANAKSITHAIYLNIRLS